ncbi:IucA/IucC family protein [Natronococcus amylolyticus DSM 10524]|uniref:IucA/IucC family protein n=1 Tax=Natronococcus amylolyticus DSM 10524 TaxID=1227497 RepID=L9XF78_9EURY|nr:IucA/IucC family protein [Natronococcus amylolyticus]ELY60277.1 IucA/IucC family protein [Natronococcus amylolyticus DSM 10524]
MSNRVDGESVRLRTSAERETLGAATSYARANGLGTPAEAAYLEALPVARREILRRFVRGLLRGRPAGVPDARFVEPADPTVPDEPTPLEGLGADELRSLVDPLSERCHRLALLPFSASETVLVAPIAARHGYDRFRFSGPMRRWSPELAGRDGASRELEHPVDLVPLLEREGAFSDGEQAERIRLEVAESVANLALARLARPVHARDVETAADADGSILEAVASGVPAADPATAFERIVTDGHPFHPSGKIRRGMNAADGLAYAPEFTDRIDLRFVAVDREYALETRAEAIEDGQLTDRLYTTFEGLEGALERAIPADRASEEYAVVPVHPLQYHRTVPERYADGIEDGRVVPIPDYTTPATPQLNLRTVVPYATNRTAEGPLPHLKLAIPVQTTNVVRTLSPHAVSNGPQVTDVVRAIEQREDLEQLGLLAEPAAACYYPPGGPHPEGEAFDDARHLSGLLRQNPASHPLVPKDGVPVVASSLVADAPTTGRPLVCRVIERYGDRTGAPTTREAALSFLERYADVVVPEQLALLSEYGVALESHLQNSLIVFEDAEPVATLVRDLGGIRVHRDRLAERGLSLEPYPDSDLEADDAADCYRKLHYALFQNHLAELVATVADEFAIDERNCWELLAERCERAFDAIRAEGRVPEDRLERDERALFAASTTHKALTAMRLRGKRHEYVTSEVANPLSAHGRERIDP